MELVNDRLNRRMASQPLEYPSAGSVFRNPSEDVPAGKLIEEAGLKNAHVNDAYVSDKHANFIINKGNATSDDIIKLINEVERVVATKYQLNLKLEQEIINW
jgi:UDP-N-acetylmuramate dehydrogenase